MTELIPGRPTLNAEQRRALALMNEGPLRVIAGPGTGKTTTVVAMYLRLLEERNLKPGQVLLLTFADNAAADLKRRIDQQFRESYDESWVSTFHSFATRVLTRYGPLYGIAPFQLINGFQEKVLMRRVLATMGGQLGALESLRSSDALVQDALWFIGILKQNLILSSTFAAQAAASGNPKLIDLASIYRAYWSEQDRLRLWDFRDVIAQCQLLLKTKAAVRDELSARFEHVIVDEYQDVDAAQVKMIAQLVAGHTPYPRLAVVGDPNQAIYSFRGTLPAYIGDLWQFGGSVIQLTKNYRSYSQILDGSDSLLDHYGLEPPRLEANRGTASVPLLVLNHEQNAVDEATAVARQIIELLDSYRPAEIAIIMRSLRRSGRPIEDALRAAGIPHESGTSPNFATSEIVRFGVAALGALAQPEDDAPLVKVIESPFAGVPAADSRRLLEEAQRRQTKFPDALATHSLFSVLKHTCFLLHDADPERWPLPWETQTSPLGPASREQLDEEQVAAAAAADSEREPTERKPTPPKTTFFDLLSDAGRDAVHRFTWRWTRLTGLTDQLAPHALAHRLFADLDVVALVLSTDLSDARRAELAGPLRMFLRALDDLDDFHSVLRGSAPTLADTLGVLEQVLPEYIDELAAPDADDGGAVRLLTVHASKGLEFPVVFLPAMAAQRFPVAARARTPLLGDTEQRWMETTLAEFQPPWPRDEADFLREEARLGYVAATRAQDMVLFSWADEYEKSEPAAKSAFLGPLTVGGVLSREYTELHRSPVMRPGSARVSADAARWEPWAIPVSFMTDAYESASSISNYLACPRKYYYGKALGLPSESGIAAKRGSAFHEALAEFHSPEREARWRHDAETAAQMYAECTTRAVAKYVAGVPGKLNQKAERKALSTLFAHYFESEILDAPPRTTLATEAKFTWHPLNDVTVMGYIDRILVLDGGHEIIDYKTGRGHSMGDVVGELGLGASVTQDFQMLIYFFGSQEGEVGDLGQLRPHVVALWYPRDVMRNGEIRKIRIVDGKDEGAGYPKERTLYLEPGQVAERRAAIVTTLGELRAGAFPPTPRHDSYTCLSAWGTGCEYAWVCPGRIEEPEEYEAQ